MLAGRRRRPCQRAARLPPPKGERCSPTRSRCLVQGRTPGAIRNINVDLVLHEQLVYVIPGPARVEVRGRLGSPARVQHATMEAASVLRLHDGVTCIQHFYAFF